jgi:hypothetical protein
MLKDGPQNEPYPFTVPSRDREPDERPSRRICRQCGKPYTVPKGAVTHARCRECAPTFDDLGNDDE